MARLVMKFGGTSVGDLERIKNVARHVAREVNAGNEVAVVVSAMAGETDKLVALCRSASVLHDAREYDAVVSSGEQVTAVEIDTPVSAESDRAERTLHFRLGTGRQVRTVRVARELLLDLDSRDRLAGVWLLDVPPFPDVP